MPQRRVRRLVFALIVALLLGIIGRNIYRRTTSSRLIAAIKAEDVSAVRTLLQWGADPNSTNGPSPSGQPALSLAIGREYALIPAQEEIACLLIQRGAHLRDPHSLRFYKSCLENACTTGSLTVVRCLLEHGADPNFVDRDQVTPLDEALDYATATKSIVGNVFTYEQRIQRSRTGQEFVRLLREHGARVNLWQAVRLEDVSALRVALDAGTPVDSGDPSVVLREHSTRTALQMAAGMGELDAVRLLLERGAHVNACSRPARWENVEGCSPLSAAISRQHLEVARLLLAHGADVKFRDGEDTAPLALAAGSLPQIVSELLRRGADINANGGAALYRAITGKQPAMVSLLLARGAHVQGRQGYVALLAALKSMPELVPLLLAKGADAHDTKRNYDIGLIRLAVEFRRSTLIPQLMRAGADVNKCDGQGTALMEAIEHQPDFVKQLLDLGADPNVPNREGRTALAVTGLPNIPNREGRTPLLATALNGDAATTRLLLAHGANADVHPIHDHTALWYARRHNHPDVAALLQQAGATE